MMTTDQRELTNMLLQGRYMMYRMSNEGKSVCMIYEGKQVPIRYFPRAAGEHLVAYLKKDTKNRLTLNLTQIRKLDGRNSVKKLYKSVKRSKESTV